MTKESRREFLQDFSAFLAVTAYRKSPAANASPPPVEQDTSPEARLLWQYPLGENFLYEAGESFYPKKAASTVRSGDRLFVRGQDRFVREIDIRTGRQLWKWKQRGVALAADRRRAFIQDEDNFVHILDARRKREAESFPLPNYGDPIPERFLHRWPGILNEHGLVQIQATGFNFYSRDGEFNFGISGATRPGFIALKGKRAVFESEGIAVGYYAPGEGNGRFAYAFKMAGKERLAYALSEDYIAIVGPRAVKGIEYDRPLLYLFHTPTKREVAQVQLPSEVTSPSEIFLMKLGKNLDTGKPQLGIYIQQPESLEPNYRNGFVWLQIGEDGRVYDIDPDSSDEKLYFNYEHIANMGVRDGWLFQFEEFARKTIIVTADFRGGYFEADRIVAIDLVGAVGNYLVFRNWDEQRSTGYDWGLPKLYTVNSKNGEQKLLAEFDKNVMHRVVRRGNSLIVIGKEAIKVDVGTGRQQTLASWGSGPKQVIDTGRTVLVETEDNRLIAFSV